jgi:hypothetical protein
MAMLSYRYIIVWLQALWLVWSAGERVFLASLYLFPPTKPVLLRRTFIYPLDVLKSRVQQQRLQPKQLQPGVLSAARAMLEESQGFSWRLVQLIFKGYPATAIRGIPVAATVLPV